ncbi:MAG: dihydroneopterin aldolase [Thermoanaerobaculales bacterium]|nr:dihydroneopterin aldolase [Thermoanaerobaculales bacterium]
MNHLAGPDTISLIGMRVFAYHGLLADEQASGQEFVIDVTVHANLAKAAKSDDIADTIDYGALAAAIHARATIERWNLIERVAERIADLVMEDPRATGVAVRVHKPAAPIRVPFEDVVVEVRRGR